MLSLHFIFLLLSSASEQKTEQTPSYIKSLCYISKHLEIATFALPVNCVVKTIVNGIIPFKH